MTIIFPLKKNMSTDYINYFIHGSIAGSISAVFTHPFLNLKMDEQNTPVNKNKIHVEIPKKITYDYLYKGLTRACIAFSIEKTLVFGTYNTILTKFNLDRKNTIDTTISGALSGTVASIWITLAEQLIIDKREGIKNYSLKHLYKGLLPTIIREALGFSIHFSIYEQLSYRYNIEKKVWKTLLIGSVAITSATLAISKIDQVKTNIQSGLPTDIFNFKTTFRGVKYALLRGIPFHSGVFVIFEYLQKNNRKTFSI
jgi:hypothetical protein